MAKPKTSRFRWYRSSLIAAGLETQREDSLICPLCWEETLYEDLTEEHIVPDSVGGNCLTLTCEPCNNNHGSKLDAHLARYQSIIDAFNGHGVLKTKLEINGSRVATDLHWGKNSKDFKIIAKASDPKACDKIHSDFVEDKVTDGMITFEYGYSQNGFKTAVLRAAYLAVFRRFGYVYLNHPVVQIIREKICNSRSQHPRIGSLVFEVRNYQIPYDRPYLITGGNINDVKFAMVLIRVRKETTTYLGAILPVPLAGYEKFFETMETCSNKMNGIKLNIPLEEIIW